MKKTGILQGLFLALMMCLAVTGAENNQGNLGSVSTGHIELRLEINEDISASFLQTNLDEFEEQDSEFRNQLSTELADSLRREANTSIPFCVMSSGGGYFEVTSFEVPGTAENKISSEFGSSVPLSIVFGEDELSSVKYKSVEEECTQNRAIPVTIQLNRQISGEEIGKIYGRFNLLIKSE